MIVCAHGDVAAFCEQRGFVICDTWTGEIEEYRGECNIIVSDKDMSECEYYDLKARLMRRGIGLISTRHTDDPRIVRILAYQMQQEKADNRGKYGGRQPYGFKRAKGCVLPVAESLVVARRIIELRDAGYTLRQIRDTEDVHHPDGRPISISTIQQIIKNRKKYEER